MALVGAELELRFLGVAAEAEGPAADRLVDPEAPWIVARALGSKRGRLLTIVILALKLALYSGALYLGVARELVSPVGVMIGMTVAAFVLVLGSLWTSSAPAKEAS